VDRLLPFGRWFPPALPQLTTFSSRCPHRAFHPTPATPALAAMYVVHAFVHFHTEFHTCWGWFGSSFPALTPCLPACLACLPLPTPPTLQVGSTFCGSHALTQQTFRFGSCHWTSLVLVLGRIWLPLTGYALLTTLLAYLRLPPVNHFARGRFPVTTAGFVPQTNTYPGQFDGWGLVTSRTCCPLNISRLRCCNG